MPSTFKERLNQAMLIRNIKAIELSEKTGISKARISQYVNGIYTPKSKATYAIAKALNISETWLMGMDVPMEPEEKVITGRVLTDCEKEIIEIFFSLSPKQQEIMYGMLEEMVKANQNNRSKLAQIQTGTDESSEGKKVFKIASSKDNHPGEVKTLSPEEAKRLDSAADVTAEDSDL